MWPNLQFPVDLVTVTEEIFNGKRHFLCSACRCFIKKIYKDVCNMPIIKKVSNVNKREKQFIQK